MHTIEVHHISKSYDEVLALNAIDLSVKSGELFGLIGPDGAGKTTLFRILTTLLLADDGTASILGHDVVKEYQSIRKEIGYMPGKFSLYQDLTVEENLNFFATLFGTSIEESYDLIQDIYVQIEPFKDRRAGKLSGGMKQKLALCCALVHKPQVLFLDEPTTGVDAVSRKEFWDVLQNLKEQGITILVSTPYMDEALQCERIALIQQGNIMQIDTPQEIIDTYPKKLYAIAGSHQYRIMQELETIEEIETVYAFGDSLHVTFKKEEENIVPKIKKNVEKKIEIKEIKPTIEDTFIRLTNDFESKNQDL
ncbi:ATP-binding cassette domain-containing protein [Flavobacteriaceae bacterium Ap0902]|nr:ATP-binding cassette domain-containing protein [Flavobacteriaceae bacterium Ap0902]